MVCATSTHTRSGWNDSTHNQLLAIDGADPRPSTVRTIAAEAAFADTVARTHRQKPAIPLGG